MNFFEGFVYFFTRMGKIFTKYNGFFGEGVRNTLIIAFFTVLFGALLGTLLAVMKMGRFKPTLSLIHISRVPGGFGPRLHRGGGLLGLHRRHHRRHQSQRQAGARDRGPVRSL